MGKGSKILKNSKAFKLGQIFILLTFFSGWIFAQQTSVTTSTTKEPPATPAKPATPIKAKGYGNPPVAYPSGQTNNYKSYKTDKGNDWDKESDDIPFEKSIEVDSKVNIDLCVSEGIVKINGWNRNEVRVFITDGGRAGFKTFGKNSDGKPTRVTILGYDPAKERVSAGRECLAGESIELDLPYGTNISRLEGRGDVEITVESLAKASVKTNESNIFLRDIKEGIVAKTFEGNITVENSGGAIDLDSVNGNILAYGLNPLENSDVLKVKSNNGRIVLQSNSHSIMDAWTISGSIDFSGNIQTDGQYSFKNTSGRILLQVPQSSSFAVQIVSQQKNFTSNLPIKVLTQDVYPPSMQKIVGECGNGEASIKLQNQTGQIIISKID